MRSSWSTGSRDWWRGRLPCFCARTGRKIESTARSTRPVANKGILINCLRRRSQMPPTSRAGSQNRPSRERAGKGRRSFRPQRPVSNCVPAGAGSRRGEAPRRGHRQNRAPIRHNLDDRIMRRMIGFDFAGTMACGALDGLPPALGPPAGASEGARAALSERPVP